MDLREARIDKGLRQEDLAERANITVQTISLLENGKTTAQSQTRRAIEEALGVRVNWLKTKGLRTMQQGKMTSWELVEQNFRKALWQINGLPIELRQEFLNLAKHYLESFEQDLNSES